MAHATEQRLTRTSASGWLASCRPLLALSLALVTLSACTADGLNADATESAGAALDSPDAFQTGVDATLGPRDKMPGAALYAAKCQSCHDGAVPKAPHFIWLEMMAPHTLVNAMTDGIMQMQSSTLSGQQKIDIAQYLSRQRYDPERGKANELNYCANTTIDAGKPVHAAGWGHDTNRFVNAQIAGISAAEVPDLRLQWTFAFPDALRARSQPTIGLGSVFVGSQDGTVYAFDLETGCVRWTYNASAEVRTGVVLTAATNDAPPMLFFGDILAKAYALNALTGEEVWAKKVDDHASATLTGTPAFHEGTVFIPISSLEVTAAATVTYDCCTFRGKVLALDALTGKQKWIAYSVAEAGTVRGTTEHGAKIISPSGAPIWASPTVDAARGLLYFGTGENYSTPADDNSDAIIAVRLADGERVWQWQATANDAWNVACMMENNPNCPPENGPDFDFGSSILRISDELLVAGHKNGSVMGLDASNPTAGPIWRTQLGRGSIQGGVHFGMAAEGERVYVPINDMNDTRNGQFLDPAAARPGMHAVDAKTGKILWQQVVENTCGENRPFCDPGISAAITAIPGVVFAGHLDGKIRAYDGASGEILWSFDSATSLDAVNGLPARGGSISGAGPAVADGHLVINSGYGLYFHEAGNALLVFGTD